MNNLETLKDRRDCIIPDDRKEMFNVCLFIRIAHLMGLSVDYKNQKYVLIKLIFCYITDLSIEEVEFYMKRPPLDLIEGLSLEQKSIVRKIHSYLSTTITLDLLKEYLVLERKRKIKMILNSPIG